MPDSDSENPEDDRLRLLTHQFDSEFLRIKEHAAWYKSRAHRDKKYFLILRITAISLGLGISLLVSIQMGIEGISALNFAVLLLSLIVAALVNVESLLGFGKSWVDHRKTELALYALQRRYRRAEEYIAALSADSVDEAIKSARILYSDLADDYEQIVSDSLERFEDRVKEDTANSSVPTIMS